MISARDARAVVLGLSALGTPRGRSSPAAVQRMVERLGYVQVDSINVLERAHHMILATRLTGYRPEHLAHPLEVSRTLFEHWTHDACVIPTAWYAHWRHRFRRDETRIADHPWWQERVGGSARTAAASILRRLRSGERLRARDLQTSAPREGGAWWDWRPEKAALEFLWRTGKATIAERDGFEKVYACTRLTLGERASVRQSSARQHTDWACSEAMARLGVATTREVAAFFAAVNMAEVQAWAARAVRAGTVVPVRIESACGTRTVPGWALPAWKGSQASCPSHSMRALSPFDPVVRDRKRLLHLFGFDYRFEAFVPAAKRVYGYYACPLIEGDRFVGRVDPKFDRASGVMVVRGPWWEDGLKADRARRARLDAAMSELAKQIGAGSWSMARPG